MKKKEEFSEKDLLKILSENEVGQTREFKIKCNVLGSMVISFTNKETGRELLLLINNIEFNIDKPGDFQGIKIDTNPFYYTGRTIISVSPNVFFKGDLTQQVTVRGVKKGDKFGFRFLGGNYPDAIIELEIFDNSWKTIFTSSISSSGKSKIIEW